MPARAFMIGWVRRAGCLGLVVAALLATRPAAASICHAPDRPTLGIEPARLGLAPAPATVIVDPTLAPPGYRSVPCSDDPAARPDHSSHLVGWYPSAPAARPVGGPRRLAAPRGDSPPTRARVGRLERPPRGV